MNIIAFTGRKGCGKDTAAKLFAEHGFINLKFADPLKSMLTAYLRGQGLDSETVYRMIEGDLKEITTPFFNGKTPRYAMQTLGTEWGREIIGTNFWADSMEHRLVASARTNVVGVVVTDLRFPNELEVIRRRGGRSVRIVRPNYKNNEFSSHVSETEIDNLIVDHEIRNDGTVEDFYNNLEWLLVDR